MSRIELRGVIVPSIYDDAWSQPYIEKGMITPESYFRRMLDEANKAEPLEVYINSPGGSVFAAYEMINATREWKTANSQPVEITIGAMAASAASAFAVSVAGKVRAHQNAKMMFHGASSFVEGGKESMEDEAELLGKINAEIQQRLIQIYKMDPDTVAEWFAEGRMGWLTSQEMLEAGIVTEIITDDAQAIEFEPAAVAVIDEHGLDIAALMEEDGESGEEQGEEEDPDDGGEPQENGEDDDSTGEGEGSGGEDSGEGEGSQDEGTGEEGPEDSEDEPEGTYQDGLAIGRSSAVSEFAEQVTDLKEKLQAAEDRCSQFQSERDKAHAQLTQTRTEADKVAAGLRLEIEQLTDRLTNYVKGALTFTPAVETWEDAMRSCGDNYVKAKEKYPDLCEKFRAEKRK